MTKITQDEVEIGASAPEEVERDAETWHQNDEDVAIVVYARGVDAGGGRVELIGYSSDTQDTGSGLVINNSDAGNGSDRSRVGISMMVAPGGYYLLEGDFDHVHIQRLGML